MLTRRISGIYIHEIVVVLIGLHCQSMVIWVDMDMEVEISAVTAG